MRLNCDANGAEWYMPIQFCILIKNWWDFLFFYEIVGGFGYVHASIGGGEAFAPSPQNNTPLCGLPGKRKVFWGKKKPTTITIFTVGRQMAL